MPARPLLRGRRCCTNSLLTRELCRRGGPLRVQPMCGRLVPVITQRDGVRDVQGGLVLPCRCIGSAALRGWNVLERGRPLARRGVHGVRAGVCLQHGLDSAIGVRAWQLCWRAQAAIVHSRACRPLPGRGGGSRLSAMCMSFVRLVHTTRWAHRRRSHVRLCPAGTARIAARSTWHLPSKKKNMIPSCQYWH